MKDDRGVEWSEVYHDEDQKKTRAGNWKAKKGVDKAELKAYESLFTGTPTESAADEPGWKNTSGGNFEIFHIFWNVDEVNSDVPPGIEKSEKFQHAVKLGLLTKV